LTADNPYTEAREQIGYISDSGIFYAIIPGPDGDYTPTASALGLTGVPNLIPESVASLLLTGPDLSLTAALRESAQPSTAKDHIPAATPTRIPGGQTIDLPPPPLPTVTATATQTATATVTAPPPPPLPPAEEPNPDGGGARW
jgi:hypothetical protein